MWWNRLIWLCNCQERDRLGVRMESQHSLVLNTSVFAVRVGFESYLHYVWSDWSPTSYLISWLFISWYVSSDNKIVCFFGLIAFVLLLFLLFLVVEIKLMTLQLPSRSLHHWAKSLAKLCFTWHLRVLRK